MSEACVLRNFWHLSAKILYTVEPKTATSPCVYLEVAASPTGEKTSLFRISTLSSTTIFAWVCFLPFAGKHRSRTVRNPFYIHLIFLWHSSYHSQAEDKDSGQNSQLIYTLTNASSAFTHFTINTTSGVISLIQPLDYESVTSIILAITVQDLGLGVQRRSTGMLTVKVEVWDAVL